MEKLLKNRRVVIGIPTYKRQEGLQRLLESIAKTEANFVPHILVADSEGKGAGTTVVKDILEKGQYPFPLSIVHVERSGISPARNTLLHEGFEKLKADLLAMVDDDETVEPEWISELVKMQNQTNADVVWGYVLPKFETETPEWAKYLTLYYRKKHLDGLTQETCGTTSVLLTRDVLYDKNGNANKFNDAFSLSGGGDAEYFTRLKKQGIKCAFSSKAISHEYFSESRINKKWALKRSFRFGTVDMRLLKMHTDENSFKIWTKEVLKIPAAICVGIIFYIICFKSPAKKMKNLSLVVRQFGKIAGLFDYHGKEYKVTHGK